MFVVMCAVAISGGRSASGLALVATLVVIVPAIVRYSNARQMKKCDRHG
ncbi:hypothetical protein [uncultured Sphingomonas sp.]|nr:hypothetical protein [uncultured Sphingomonas sp.]